MNRRVTIQLVNGELVVHDFPDTVIAHDGVLTVDLGRNRFVRYPLTSVTSWEVDR